MDPQRLSELLSGHQSITGPDMDRIAGALGKDTAFFLTGASTPDPQFKDQNAHATATEISFSFGDPHTKQERPDRTEQERLDRTEQEETAQKILALLENIDEVLGARDRFLSVRGGT